MAKTVSKEEAAAGRQAVDELIASQPQAIRERLITLRQTIAVGAPAATERIAYGLPTFYLRGNLIHYGPAAHHIGLYPGASGVAGFTERLDAEGFKYSKGAIQLPHDRPLPLDLVRDIVAYRLAERTP
jgi:uncharacterized protein YdhG (YjbR/CyaY superfamily)